MRNLLIGIDSGTQSTKVLVVDAKNGKVLWKTEVGKWREGYTITSAPLYHNGVIYTGIAGGRALIRFQRVLKIQQSQFHSVVEHHDVFGMIIAQYRYAMMTGNRRKDRLPCRTEGIAIDTDGEFTLTVSVVNAMNIAPVKTAPITVRKPWFREGKNLFGGDVRAITAAPEFTRRELVQMIKSTDQQLPPPALLAYRVYQNGKEELVRGVQLSEIPIRTWKDVIGASKEKTVYNFLASDAPQLTLRVQGADRVLDCAVRREDDHRRVAPLVAYHPEQVEAAQSWHLLVGDDHVHRFDAEDLQRGVRGVGDARGVPHAVQHGMEGAAHLRVVIDAQDPGRWMRGGRNGRGGHIGRDGHVGGSTKRE